jgi:LPXTG-motif cell wall-anchored protein
MKSKLSIATCSLALLVALALPSLVRADAWDHATKLTFSEPVELPGTVLPAGTYWFTLFDSSSNRHIVQVWNGDRTQLLKTILAIPDYRLQPTGQTVINFDERPVNSPEAIHSWFYPGANYGEEFVYPKARATQLAQQVNRPVLSMRDEPKPTEIQQTPVSGVTPGGNEVDVTEIVTTKEVVVSEVPASLPQTGSSLPLYGLIGFLSLVTAAGLGVAVRNEG